ncbi:26S proteasome complex subunit SEM1-like [Ursus americanus]|uniref:26S proteasome complex subunit SEM1 n=1 Tax=Ursus maritimus TaxID=29073 RepID=A0A384BKH1_URSMA|nr:26S proteasome complex subunit SEM1-like [Ursus maritimus]XP_045659927.1 26S proteasome complex subunit SEM1-like [Ursus americanus]
MLEKKQPVDLELMEEDWASLDEDEDTHVWEDDWDDDNVENDFPSQLGAEIQKHGYKVETSWHPEELLKQPKLELFTKF